MLSMESMIAISSRRGGGGRQTFPAPLSKCIRAHCGLLHKISHRKEKEMKKRIISMLLALIMALSLLPMSALAADDPTVENLGAFFAAATTIKDYKLTDFTFEKGKTTYDLSVSDVPAVYAFRFELSKIPPALTYVQTYKDGQFLQRLPVRNQAASASFQRKYLPALGESATYKVIIGTKESQAAEDFTAKYAEYTFNITTSIPSLSAFAVKDASGTALAFTNVAKFDNKRIDIKDYAVAIPSDASAIKLTATSPTAGMQFRIGEKLYDSLNDETIELAPFATENAGEYKLPIVLTKNGYENTYTLTVTKQDYTPKITQQPESITCNKGDTPTLSIVAEKAAGVTEELTYQWFSRTGSFKEIPGATSSTYTPPTNRAGEIMYRCDVSSTVNGTKHTIQSDFVTVTVNLSSVDAPEITRQPGTFKVEKYGISESYKTEYFVGEKLDQIYIGLDMLEAGEVYSYKWYYNTENMTTGGTPLEESDAGGVDRDGTWCQGFNINKRFEEGTYYLYCEVTASSESDPTLTATTTTDTTAVTFTRAQIDGFVGKGSETEPYLINTADDFVRLRAVVEQRQFCTGLYFKMTDDITLPEDWEPIGREHDADENPRALPYMGYRVFRGILDGGGHKLTIPEGGKPLFNYTSDAVIRNLDIYGSKIDGYGLINKWFIDYGTDNVWNYGDPVCVTIENVKLLSGSKTLRSGFLEGSGSGINTVTIRNCTIEENVVIGYDKTTQGIGSFVGGAFNGVIENCKSYATVYGRSSVGGLAAGKGQTMGLCKVKNSQFYGQVIATGDWVGGILGMGYADLGETRSAPNSPWVTIENCTVIGSVTGRNYVGGVFGAEIATTQCWGNDFGSDEYTASSSGSITNNTFEGTITATGDYVGGVIGYIEALNRFSVVANNYYNADCGVDKGIGFVKYVDTNCATHETASDAIYFDTSKALPGIAGVVMKDHNRTDDPLGTDKEKLCSTKKRTDVYVTNLALTGEYKTEYRVGDTFDTTGMVFTATWSNGKTTTVKTKDVIFEGFNSKKPGQLIIIAKYGDGSVNFSVLVKPQGGKKITVVFSLLGDTVHGENGQSHTLADGNLLKWIDAVKITVDSDANLLDVVKAALGDQYTIENESGNYIQSITPKGGKALGEFTNGNLSGWMYTLNGKHSNLGVAQQYLINGDVIVFHYTDDYNRENAFDQQKSADEVITMIAAIGTVSLSKGAAISQARTAYDKLSADEKALVTNYDKLLAAEAAYAKLVAEMGEKLDEIYKTTGDFMATLGTPTVNSTGGEWMVIGLARSGRPVPAGYYDNVVKFVRENADKNERLDRNKVTENARVILALTAIGKDVTNVDGHNLLKGLDSMSYIKTQGINGPIFTLIALDSHNYPTMGDVTREKLIETILGAALEDGGWNLSGENADTDMTAMAIQALAPYYKTNETVKAAVDKALEALSALQRNDGGFGSWGTVNSESCAQVIVALTALGIDPTADSRFVKNDLTVLDALASFYVTGGGFRHTAGGERNGMATEQGYYALASYYRFVNAQTRLYDMTDVTIQTGGSNTPATGDTGVLVWVIALPVAAVAAAFVLKRKKREE